MKLKTLTSLIIMFSILIINGQELKLENFTYVDNSLIWQKVYDLKLPIEEMMSKVKFLPIVDKIISEDESSITISCKKINHDYKALGGSEMNTSMYVARMSSLGNVVFQFKEDRYRVTFTDIILEQEYTVNAGILTSEKDEQDPLSLYAVKGNQSNWRNGFRKKDYKILDYSYSEAFDITSNKSKVLDDKF